MADLFSPATDSDGELKQACASGPLARVQSILQSHISTGQVLPADENLAQYYLQECVFQAFVNRHLDIARYLLGETGVEWKPMEKTLVEHALREVMPVEMFEFLVQEGWDVNRSVYHDYPPLGHILDSFPHVKWFIENGADPNVGPDPAWLFTRKSAAIPESGFVLARAACTDPQTAISLIEYLREHGLSLKNGFPLHRVSQKRPYDPTPKVPSLTLSYPDFSDEIDLPDVPTSASRLPVLKYLLDLGFDPNASDFPACGPHSIGPPLHYAIRGGAVENARFLLENGADPWVDNYLGQSTLQAARYGLDTRRTAAMQKILKEYM